MWIFSKKRNGKEVIILSLIIDFILGIVQSIRVAMTKWYVAKVQDYNNRDFYNWVNLTFKNIVIQGDQF